MVSASRLGRFVLFVCVAAQVGLCAKARARQPVPIADAVEKPLLPSGISRHPVHLNSPLALVFKDPDGADAMHFLGGFVLRFGTGEGRTVESQEAIVWISRHSQGGTAYVHLDVLLWRGAVVRETGGTVTSGPALMLTLNTTGKIVADVDEFTHQASTEGAPYTTGNAIRKAIASGEVPGASRPTIHDVLTLTGGPTTTARPRPRPTIHVRSDGELAVTETEQAGRVMTVVGGVYLSRGVAGREAHFEIRADSVVVFLAPKDASGPRLIGPEGDGLGRRTRPPQRDEPPGEGPDAGAGDTADRSAPRPRWIGERPAGAGPGGLRARRRRRDQEAAAGQRLSAGFGEMDVEGAYLEGDVLMTQGASTIQASRLYYDFRADRAVILDAVVRTALVERNIPLYLRAAEIRQLSESHFTATGAVLTTSEFHTPHYHIGAERIELSNLSIAAAGGGAAGPRGGRFDIRHATLNIGNTPVFYWPHMRGNLDTSETSIRSVRTGFSDVFGLEFETRWDMFGVLGFETPDGFDATLSLDSYTQRGPAVGANATYQRDRYYGVLRSYLLSDSGVDFLGRNRPPSAQRDVRGRFLLRHRQYLKNDWQLSLEISYISDRGFLEEFFESEFDNDKEQETLLFLKQQRDNRAFTAMLQARVLDFTTQVERLPDLALHVAGEPLGERVTGYSENRIGLVRFRPAEQTFFDFLRDGRRRASGVVQRIDTRQEIGVPMDVGPLRLVPFASVRGTLWDDTPRQGGLARVFGIYGVRGGLYLSRVFPDVRSSLFDLDGLRHIIKTEFVAWVANTNRDSSELFEFDETVEGIDEVDGAMIGLRQRWQTRRGVGETRRTVDFLTWDVDLGLFSDAEPGEITNGFTSFSRPENSISRNYLNSSLIWRVNDRTALVSEVNYDVNDGEVDILNVSMAVERPPRLSYLFGYRFIQESNSNLLGFDMNYKLTEKHSVALRESFDLARGQTVEFTVALIRKFPRWFSALSFALDEAENDFGVSLSLWPEGFPQATLGSRRFTGVENITRLRRN